MAEREEWTAARIRALGVTTSLGRAAAVLGIGRTLGYRLAADGQFPVPLIRAGHRILVPVAALLQLLHLDPTPQPVDAGPAGGRLDQPPKRRVDDTIAPADWPPPAGCGEHTEADEDQP